MYSSMSLCSGVVPDFDPHKYGLSLSLHLTKIQLGPMPVILYLELDFMQYTP